MKRFVQSAITLIAASAFTLAHAATPATPLTKTIPVSPQEKAKIQQVVHDYLINQPEVLVEALQTLQRKQFEQAQQTVKQTQQTANNYATQLLDQKNDPMAGNANGKITVVEFFDYQCPHCMDMAPVMSAIVKANPDVRIVYKEFPIRGPVSDIAARAALAANKQGKYMPLHEAMLTTKQPLTEELIYKMAQNAGINVPQLKQDMNDAAIKSQLQANVTLAQNLKLFGTPAFFIGKSDVKNNQGTLNYVPGQMDQSQLELAIQQAGK